MTRCITVFAYILSIHVTIRKHHRRVVFVQRLTGHVAYESGLSAVRKRKFSRETVEIGTADGTRGVLSRITVDIALTGNGGLGC